MNAALAEALQASAAAVEAELDRLATVPDALEARVWEAMRYSLFAGGKRLRPFLVMATGDLFFVPHDSSVRAAAAIEMIHTYSLIHDDLPCMDDDDLRRGKPTNHRQFDEATAVLAGDALQPLAFRTLLDPATDPSADIRLDLAQRLARAAGAEGMVGGQMIDLQAETTSYDLDQITRLQNMKTGALIAWSCEAGAILGRATAREREALKAYGLDLGLAFQIADDLLDAAGSAEEMGKAVGKDAEAGKETFITLMGPEGARKRAEELVAHAVARLDLFGERAFLLREVARYVIDRRS
ncbi:polyprenyl synthetase family protein [Minwuia thermotolerans]|uniref:Farnesyl-diphosphate synthase n=1 Tax=Minwuia thermotolerans TaxID=2056226 RepID=A0A2M9G2W8_9PROT|nr:farnesyl diphosphate synthase [Minwuia thermotolerans]PJK30053.1 farnesyl-diphosphate synthase [Minwuia thermotolerans]